MKRFTLIFFCIWILGCSQQNDNPCDLSYEVLNALSEIDSLVGIPENIERQKNIMKYNYDEPSLFSSELEVYRFGINCHGSSSFDKFVRIERSSNSNYNAVVKVFERNGIDKYDSSIAVFPIEKEKWETFQSELGKINFWTRIEDCDKMLLSGCTWSIQAYNPIENPCTSKNFHMIVGCYPVDSIYIPVFEFFDNLNEK